MIKTILVSLKKAQVHTMLRSGKVATQKDKSTALTSAMIERGD